MHFALVISSCVTSLLLGNDIEIFGKKVNEKNFLKMAKPVSASELAKPKKWIGKAVVIEGKLKSLGNEWKVETYQKNGATDGDVLIEAAKFKDDLPREGQSINVWGVAKEGAAMRGELWKLVPPGVEWQYKVLPTVGSAGMTVEGLVKNTSRQPIAKLQLAVKLYDPINPQQFWVDEVILYDLKAGETKVLKSFIVTTGFKATKEMRVPACEIVATDYDL